MGRYAKTPFLELGEALEAGSFIQAVQELTWPGASAQPADLREFGHQLRAVAIEQRDVGHRWELSPEQWQLLADYLAANQLLVECMQLATLPDRTAVENQLLLPPT